MRLGSTVAIVTGGGKGIGRTICTTLAAEGASVVVADMDLAAAEETAAMLRRQGRESLALQVNVTNKTQVQAMVSRVVDAFGRIDVLMNNVGILAIGSVLELTEETWDKVMTVNTKGTFLCSQAVLPVMIRQGHGKIINMSSQAGKEGSALSSAYAASKHAVIGFTQSLAKEVGEYNITVNAVCPGSVDTEMLDTIYFPEKARLSGKSPEEYRKAFVDRIPMKRMARPEEVGYLVVFLASSEADYITGTAVNVAGGSSVH
jgi:meso-butanediol dehydrogenase / (S,S)-butanediol dehydrogenase / diacetyl reductase